MSSDNLAYLFFLYVVRGRAIPVAAQGVYYSWCMIQSASVRSHPPRNWIELDVLHPTLICTQIPCECGQALLIGRFIVLQGMGEEQNERLHVLVKSSAIDIDIERGIGLWVTYSQGSRPVMDLRCLNLDCGSQPCCSSGKVGNEVVISM